MTTISGSLLSFGSREIFEFSKTMKNISGKFVGLDRSNLYWGGGGGRFTPLMAAAAAAFVRDKIRSGGSGLSQRGGYSTYPLTKKWLAVKKKYAKSSDPPVGNSVTTGSLYKSIKVLRRRKKGKGRSMTVGVSQKIHVPHFGGVGIKAPIKKVAVADYAHQINISSATPRPLILTAIIKFAEKVWPTGKKTLEKARDNFIKKNFSSAALTKAAKTDDQVDLELAKDTKKMMKSLISDCGFSSEAASEFITNFNKDTQK